MRNNARSKTVQNDRREAPARSRPATARRKGGIPARSPPCRQQRGEGRRSAASSPAAPCRASPCSGLRSPDRRRGPALSLRPPRSLPRGPRSPCAPHLLVAAAAGLGGRHGAGRARAERAAGARRCPAASRRALLKRRPRSRGLFAAAPLPPSLRPSRSVAPSSRPAPPRPAPPAAGGLGPERNRRPRWAWRCCGCCAEISTASDPKFTAPHAGDGRRLHGPLGAGCANCCPGAGHRITERRVGRDP